MYKHLVFRVHTSWVKTLAVPRGQKAGQVVESAATQKPESWLNAKKKVPCDVLFSCPFAKNVLWVFCTGSPKWSSTSRIFEVSLKKQALPELWSPGAGFTLRCSSRPKMSRMGILWPTRKTWEDSVNDLT